MVKDEVPEDTVSSDLHHVFFKKAKRFSVPMDDVDVTLTLLHHNHAVRFCQTQSCVVQRMQLNLNVPEVVLDDLLQMDRHIVTVHKYRPRAAGQSRGCSQRRTNKVSEMNSFSVI